MEQQPAYTYSFGLGANGLKMLIISLLVILGSAGLSLLAVFWYTRRMAHQTPATASGQGPLLVLGVKLQDCRPVADFRLRLRRASSLLQQGHPGPVYILGGETSPGCGSEAACGRDFLLAEGVDTSLLHLEDRSRHTLENLRFIRAMLDGREAVVITNRYHLARTGALAKGLGMPHRLCAAEDRWQPGLRNGAKLLREAFFLHWYYSGAIWARLVADRASLERIS